MEEKKVKKVSLGMAVCFIIIGILLISIIGIIIYYNCGLDDVITKKQTISLETFKEKCDKKSINVYDAASYNKLIEGAKAGYIHGDDSKYKINYWNMIDENYAWYNYYEAIITIENNNKGQIIETNEVKANYAKYTAISNGVYYVILKNDNFVIWAKTDSDKKDDLESVLNEIFF